MPAAAEAGRAHGQEGMLLIDLVDSIAGFGFCGFDLEPVLLSGGGEEAPAPFFWVAPFFEGAFSGAPCAPCSATAAASLVSALVMLVIPVLFLRLVGA